LDGPDWAAARPNWGVVSDMMGELRRATAGIPETQRRMLAVTGEAWSDDRLIRVLVGPRGHLLELDIDPRVFRKPDSKALSAAIIATVRLAVEDATAQAKAIFEEGLPSDMRAGGLIGNLDFAKTAFGHDADVRSKGDGDEAR
jgi:DNA-binding protein YbaB